MPSPIKQFTDLWQQLKSGQRMAIVAAAVATIGLMAALIFYGSQPEYAVLFSDLKPADAQGIVEKLKAANVPYKLSEGGTALSVPTERVSELRLQVAASGALSGGHVGFDLFDRNNFGATDFAQQVNYQRALEGELARTLEGLDEVESARVHITQARESVFTEQAQHAKASIMLRVRQGRELSRERTESIINLVGSAVEGLDPADVSMTDTLGRVLSAPGHGARAGDSASFNEHLDMRRKFESETASRIISLLEPVSGIGHVRADVAADLDFSQIEQTEEKYDPKSAVIRSQQMTQEARNTAAPLQGGGAGARANDTSAQGANGAAQSAAAQNKTISTGDQRSATTTTFEIDKTVKHTLGGGGRVTRLSVSVVVDYKGVNGTQTTRTPEELKKMQDLVAAAVGIDAERGDQIVVQSIPFDQPTIETKAPTWLDHNRDLVRTAIKYGALVFAALLVILFVVRPARKALRSAAGARQPQLLTAGETLTLGGQRAGDLAAQLSESMSGEQAAPRTVAEIEAEMEAEVAREMASFMPDVKRAAAVKRQLVDQTQKDPELAAKTIRGWLHEARS